MSRVPDDVKRNLQVPVWSKYKEIIDAAEGKKINVEYVERYAFYERAKKAYAIVATGETAQYGNIIIKKGIVHPK